MTGKILISERRAMCHGCFRPVLYGGQIRYDGNKVYHFFCFEPNRELVVRLNAAWFGWKDLI